MKQGIERGTGDKFIDWYNERHGRQFSFLEKPEEAPDLLYSDGKETVPLEITTTWYSQNIAKFTMRYLRGKSEIGVNSAVTHEPEKALTSEICAAIARKSLKDYGSRCLLIVRIGSDGLTTKWEMENEVIPNIVLPDRLPFQGVYLMDRTGTNIWVIN